MTRGTPTTFTTALAQVNPKTVNLIEIATGGTPMRFTDYDRAITFNGSTFAPRPFLIGEPRVDGENQQEVEMTLADVDLEIDTWLLSIDISNRRVTRYRVEVDNLTPASNALSEVYRVEDRARGDRSVRLTLAPLSAILAHWRVPADILTRDEYPGIREEGTAQ